MITETTSATTAASATPQQSGSGAALASDFETFLKMLTAQARYQDPLEPLDSSEYAAQLAQFSMVEQQVQTNDLLSGLVAALGGLELEELSGWVGMEVLAVAPTEFDGTPVTVLPTPMPDADEAYLVVKTTAGETVSKIEIPVAAELFTWTGQDGSGAALPSGQYSFSVESYQNGTLLADEPAPTYHHVTEAQLMNNETLLTLSGGEALPSTYVYAIKAGS